jgi:hypothetical protein
MTAGVGFFAGLFIYTPLILVWISGLLLAVSLWNRHRAVAILLASACALALLTDLAGAAYNASIPFLYSARVRSAARLGIISAVIGVIRGLLMAVAWGLALAAIWRAVHGPRSARPE